MLIVGFILGLQYTYAHFIISLVALSALVYVDLWEKKQLIKHTKEKIKQKWGEEHREKRNFSSIRKLYDFLEKEENQFIIDDITWRDMNMDSIFSKLDHTESLPGMQKLYDLLRKPLFSKVELEERNKSINLFLDKKEQLKEIQYPLYLLGKKDSKELFLFFENGMNVETKYLIIYRIMSLMTIIAAALFLINQETAIGLFIISIGINALIYQKNKNKVYGEIETFKYVGSLIKTTRDIVNADIADVDIKKEEMEELLKDTKDIYKKVSSLSSSEQALPQLFQLLVDYINMVLLRETIIFYTAVNLINQHRKEILEMYKIVGEIDAYIAIASFKDGLDYYSQPKLIEDNSEFYLKVKDLYHPLLENPVSYSFELDNKGALVTGSNASGKSTYLRTIGINTIFAQTMYITLAKEYRSNYYRLLTSIGTTDSIEEGDSYFMAEAKSLKRIIESLDGGVPVLCILDEIFRGTNTVERISSATEVLNYMIDRNTLVIAATHDIELTTLISDKFYNYHFKESVEEHDITFDYVLRNGPATSRNAIAILKYLGYPKLIYENADKSAMKYETEAKSY